MTSRAKRVTLIIGVAALVTLIAGSVMAPQTIAAPKKKPPQPTTFWIETDEYAADFGYMSGYFYAGGALDDWGTAYERLYWPETIVYLDGATGFMRIKVTGDTFEVVYAIDGYSHLLGATGTCSEEWEMWGRKNKEQYPLAVYRTFEGSVPE